jgi:hypothetical protein
VCGLIQQTAKLSSNERIFLGVSETWFSYDTFCNQQISKSFSSLLLLLLLLLLFFFFFSSSSLLILLLFFFFFFSLGLYSPLRTFTTLMDFPQSAVFLTSLSNL